MTKPFDAEQARAAVETVQIAHVEFAKSFIDNEVRASFENSKSKIVTFDVTKLSNNQLFAIIEELRVRGFSIKTETYLNETNLYIEA